jgi:hypothetical protein
MAKFSAKKCLFALTSVLLLSACKASLFDSCDDQITSSINSIDRKFIATAFVRNCGATTDYTSIVSLRESGSSFDGDDDEGIVFVATGQHHLAIQWISSNEVRVICRECTPADIFKQKRLWKGIRVLF